MNNIHASRPVDLLLINASNLPYEPFYPYAFVMLSARAKKKGISVKRLELSNLTTERVELWIENYIRTYQPRLIGFTLRQTDSYTIQEYMDQSAVPYYPLVNLKKVIHLVQKRTRSPIIIGGYGFTLHALGIMRYLNVDYGLKGGVDPLFEHFEDILANRNLDAIPNLVYRENGHYRENRQIYYPPMNDREYDEELISDIIGYYGRLISHGHAYLTLYNRGVPICFGTDGHNRKILSYLSQTPSIPIEVSRGCCFNCYFCSEPLVKGRKVAYRDLDVIEEEVRFGVSHQLREFWFVCSELNLGDSAFALALAERMIQINETLGQHKVIWKAYHLPHWFSPSDFKTLYRSGFVTTWNDVVALDDQQLRKARVPYRSSDAIQFLKNDFAIRQEKDLLPPLKFSIFLGDLFLTPASLSQTLKTFDEHGLKNICGGSAGVNGIRIFDPQRNQAEPQNWFTYAPDDVEGDPDLIFPTFQVSPKLFETFATLDEIVKFFDYICQNLLSDDYQAQHDWNYFLAVTITPGRLAELLQSSCLSAPLATEFDNIAATFNRPVREAVWKTVAQPNLTSLKKILYPPPAEKGAYQQIAELLTRYLYCLHFESLEPILRFLDLPVADDYHVSLSSRRLLKALYRQAEHNTELIHGVVQELELAEDSPGLFLLHYLIYQRNVYLHPRYKTWLFPEPQIASNSA